MRALGRPARALVIAWMITHFGPHVIASAADQSVSPPDSPAAALAEVRQKFTINGQPIPPEIFRDFGDGDLADSGSIWVTVDVAAAIGSNLYADTIKQDHGWVSQSKPNQSMNGKEETGYEYIGATENRLLVVLASYSGGGSGEFMTLHILDLAAVRAIGIDGKDYQRINLTNVRSYILGDRWNGEVSIAKNVIRITTTQDGPAGGTRPPVTITATRP